MMLTLLIESFPPLNFQALYIWGGVNSVIKLLAIFILIDLGKNSFQLLQYYVVIKMIIPYNFNHIIYLKLVYLIYIIYIYNVQYNK